MNMCVILLCTHEQQQALLGIFGGWWTIVWSYQVSFTHTHGTTLIWTHPHHESDRGSSRYDVCPDLHPAAPLISLRHNESVTHWFVITCNHYREYYPTVSSAVWHALGVIRRHVVTYRQQCFSWMEAVMKALFVNRTNWRTCFTI